MADELLIQQTSAWALQLEAEAMSARSEYYRLLYANQAKALRKLIAIASAPPPPARGDEWRLVPVEPTDEMIVAMMNCTNTPATDSWSAYYRAMLTAAPPETQG